MDIGAQQSGPTQTEGIRRASKSVLHLPRAVYRDLRAHGEQTWPRECCGALLGRAMQGGGPEGWQVDLLMRAVNIRAGSSLDRYEIAPAELAGIVLEARNRGLEIVGFYHSHPGHPAQPSSTDLAEAHWLGCSYVITEVTHGKAALTNAFLLAGTTEENKHFEPQTIQIEDRSAEPHRA
jgi:proteasome lid subunit RPN8/RPN11